MGGHGGLNILPQKRWNVYNYENREKVRKDEEAAAREDQLRREQSRRRDAEFRLERLRQARGLENPSAVSAPSDSHHINLFDAIPELSSEPDRKPKKNEDDHKDPKKRKREEPRVVPPEDEKYKLGYGLIGKGVKAPWYMSGASLFTPEGGDEGPGSSGGVEGSANKSGGKKTIEEMREERMKREKREKERESRLLASAGKKEVAKGYSRRPF